MVSTVCAIPTNFSTACIELPVLLPLLIQRCAEKETWDHDIHLIFSVEMNTQITQATSSSSALRNADASEKESQFKNASLYHRHPESVQKKRLGIDASLITHISIKMFRPAAVIRVKNRLKQNAALAAQARQANVKVGGSALENVENWLKLQIGVQGSCKDFVEAHIAEKCQNRSDADRVFKWDFFMFITYSLFLLLYSYSACSTNMKGKLITRNLLQPEVGNFDDVQVIGNYVVCSIRFAPSSKYKSALYF